MTTSRVPFTFGAMTEEKGIKGYLIHYHPGNSTNLSSVTIKAKSLVNLRLRMTHENMADIYKAYVHDSKTGKFVGGLQKSGGKYFWFNQDGIWRIQSNSGRLGRKLRRV